MAKEHAHFFSQAEQEVLMEKEQKPGESAGKSRRQIKCVCGGQVRSLEWNGWKKIEILSFSDLLETLDSDRGPLDLDLSAKMEAQDPSRAEIFIILPERLGR